MTKPLTDTDTAARDVLDELYARMTPREKLEKVRGLTLDAARLSLAGIHTRHPSLTKGELLLRLAVLRLGPTVVQEAYAPGPDGDDT